VSTVSVPTLEDLGDLDGKRVLLRADFNVPLRDGEITDDLRIRAALPTIEWLQAAGAQVTACSHLGRPKGAPDPRWSMDPVRARLAELAPGVELLENLRFDAGETADDPAFVQRLIEGQDAYVLDAFGAAHRAHASVVGPPRFLPSAAGRLLQREVEVLLPLRTDPRRPFVVVLGGSKVSDKLGVIEALGQVADTMLIGGGMCFTFLAAQGHEVGDSLLEADQIETCRRLLDSGLRIVVPTDVVALGPGGEIGDPRLVARCSAWAPTCPRGTAASTSVPAPPRPSLTRSPVRAPCSGTAPWACSRIPASPRAPAPWPGHSHRRGGSPSWAVATRRRRWPSSASPLTWTTSPPVAVPLSSCSSRATSRVSLPCVPPPTPVEPFVTTRRPHG